jgi:protein gp37
MINQVYYDVSNTSKIPWTRASWNPITGCDRISAGCVHCYAERMAHRLQKIGQAKYKNGFKVTVHDDVLSLPLTWKKPRLIFVNSMSDLFHEEVPLEFIKKIFGVMRRADWHIFQILTKRSGRMLELAPELVWPENVWAGVTVESSKYYSRLDDLRQVPAAIRYVSVEPMLGPMPDFPVEGIDWIILGGESGPGARPMHKDWVIRIRDRCAKYDIPFFFKQWGGFNRKETGCMLDGKYYHEMPRLKSPSSDLMLDL